MNFKYLDNKTLETALKEYLEELEKQISFKTEVIKVKESLNRYNSKAVYAVDSSPDYYASAMDGIAVKSSNTYGANETNPLTLKIDVDFVIIDTGDPVPDIFDAVIMMEDVIFIDNETVKIITSAYPFLNIRQIGEDICKNEMILPSFSLLSPSAIGSLIAGGVNYIEVIKTPIVAIIPTGDEIIEVNEDSTPNIKGKIKEFNSAVFSAFLEDWGAKSIVYPIIPDNIEMLKETLLNAVDSSDIVLINAGSSAGRDDYTSKVIELTGKVLTHGISIKPGKPTALGIVSNKPVIGIPGYPVSGIIVLNNIVKKIVEIWGKVHTNYNPYIQAKLSRKIVSSLKYKEFIRVRLGEINDEIICFPLNSGAGIISSYQKADGIMIIDKNAEGIEAGSTVNIELLKPLDEIKKSIVITGSHDPMLDEIDDIMRLNKTGYTLSTTHVGSMGGIYAIKRGETHIAGIHLFDVESGLYNKPYIDKYLSNKDCILIKGFKRLQGIIVENGNKHHIKSISDIIDNKIRFVNRQKGAGTRILFDHLLESNNLDKNMINGYNREEFTHMSLAQQIASGGADAGVGLYSAAKIYELDFIPICEEEYDFVVLKDFYNSDKFKVFFDLINSEEFITRMTKAGGYSKI